ncbi:cysteine dioxygenase [Ralstonia flaminis]|jgi:predicted metal-dependent enzyme (double-stranded beta helix superfamily)|uniref:3-mercaptopropionate dioxygenase n=1 Tax=Ralstonia flaminis TaxID=3058597 RepID=A0ABN9JS91_9RALS|nr:cysteine dioxygenase [Ralstonia sp. LMG 18101]CAJ0819218.1 3-mercaptopropionate dioxygenase [Ralstonia sp. LMG 18101]
MSTPALATAPAQAQSPQSILPLRDFVIALSRLLDQQPTEAEILSRAGALLGALVAHDDWLPAEYAQPHPEHFQQYLLHVDSGERFSIVSFVWGPGQRTPIHDHTTWGLIGMLRGAEYSQPFKLEADGRPLPDGPAIRLEPGQVERVSPRVGDIHRVHNAFDDRTSISIHVYGGNIGGIHRAVYTEDGERKPFISGYSNTHLPNLWDRSKDTSAS